MEKPTIEDIVYSINIDLFEKNPSNKEIECGEIGLEYISNGYCSSVSFLNHVIYSSEETPAWEEDDSDRDFEKYFLKEMKKIIKQISELKVD